MITNMKYKAFLMTTAACSFLGALTTILLVFLPNPTAYDFESSVLLYDNSLYLTKLWILFIHPQVNVLASFGIAYLLLRKYPLQIIIGTFFLLVWAYTEMSQQSLLIDALNQMWRPGYVNAENDDLKNTFSTLIKSVSGVSDSNYFLLLYGFAIGSLLYGFAFIQENLFGKSIGWVLVFIGVLSLSSFARYYLRVSFLNEIVNWVYEYVYTYLQPTVRIAIGVWIIRETKALLSARS